MKTIRMVSVVALSLASITAFAGEPVIGGGATTQGFPGFGRGRPVMPQPTPTMAPQGFPGFAGRGRPTLPQPEPTAAPQGFPDFGVPSIEKTIRANLNKFNIAQNGVLPSDVVDGTIEVDTASSVVRLSLQPAFSCPNGQICAQVMPALEVVELPLISTNAGSCVTTYVASEDLRPVDGLFTQITVRDFSEGLKRCKFARAVATTEVEHVVRGVSFQTGVAFEQVSSFSSEEALQ